MPPTQAVVTAVRLVIKGEFPVFPIEGAGINNHASDPVAVATEPFGQGVNDNAGAVLDRPRQVGSGKSAVHDQGNAVVGRYFSDRFQIGHAQTGIAHGFAKEGLGLVGDGGRIVLRIIRIDEFNVDPELGKDVVELGIGSSVQVVGGNDLVPFLSQVDDRIEDPAGTGGDPETGGTSLKSGNALLENARSRVHQAGVDVAQLAKSEQVGGVLRVVEDEGTRLVHGHGP